MSSEFYWKEYPDCDREYVRWYPCNISRLDENEHLKKDPYVFYIHIPFCNNVCSCCLYNKQSTDGDVLKNYLTALKHEIDLYCQNPAVRNAQFIAGYIGGGTPTVLSEEQLDDLLGYIREKLDILPGAPVTVETTPVDITREKANVLLKHGVNRISLGVQSFHDILLRRIGRTHTRHQAVESIRMLKAAGFREINIDLMYGLPGDSMKAWAETLEVLDGLNIESVSLYYYIVLPDSRLKLRIDQGRMAPCPGEPEAEALYTYAVNYLLSRKYVAVSPNDFGKDNRAGEDGWAKEGAVSFILDREKGYKAAMADTMERTRYISHCWYHNRPMLAFGAGAYGYLRGHTYFNQPDLERYMRTLREGHLPVVMGADVNLDEMLRRNMILAVKLLYISREDFAEEYGIDFADYFHEEITLLAAQGLVELTDQALIVTFPKGWKYIDNISKAFYSKNNYRLPQPAPTNTNLMDYIINGKENTDVQ